MQPRDSVTVSSLGRTLIGPEALGLQVQGREVHHAGVAGGGFLISGGYAPKLFYLGEVVFDEVAFGVLVGVVPQLHFGRAALRYDCFDLGGCELGADFIAVEGFVRDQLLRRDSFQESFNVVSFIEVTWSDREFDQSAELVHQRHQFCSQPASASADGLSTGRALSFREPVPC